MLFNPECEHCQKETERFLSMPEIFKKAQLVMISMESLEKTKLFSQRYQLEKNPCIYIGKDFKRFFIGYFMAQTIPVMAFYDQKKSLLFYKQGDVTEKEIQEKIK